jgi:hypothetical protein
MRKTQGFSCFLKRIFVCVGKTCRNEDIITLLKQ